jgi:hypothetical protein
VLHAGAYEIKGRVMQNDDCGCESDWSKPVTVTVADMEIPSFLVADCDANSSDEYRTDHIPITLRTGIRKTTPSLSPITPFHHSTGREK